MTTILVIALYMIPTIAAYAVKHHNRSSILIINLLLGWTFIGWVVALAMAATTVKKVV